MVNSLVTLIPGTIVFKQECVPAGPHQVLEMLEFLLVCFVISITYCILHVLWFARQWHCGTERELTEDVHLRVTGGHMLTGL